MKSFYSEIKGYLAKNPPTTIEQARAEIAELTGVHRKEIQMRRYLKSLGLQRRKVGAIPAKADVQA